jgi:drug/metabolite transporter (DMT)-like permease
MSSQDAAAPARVRQSAPGATEYALLAGISLAWGTSYMFTKIAVAAVPPLTLIAVRTVIAAASMLGHGRSARPSRPPRHAARSFRPRRSGTRQKAKSGWMSMGSASRPVISTR